MIATLLLLACASGDTNPGATSSANAPMPAVAPAIAQDPDGVVATWEGGQLTYKDLQSTLDNQLKLLEVEYLQSRYNLERQALDEDALYKILDAEAAKRGVTTEELLKVEVEDKVTPPTNAEVEEFYPVVRRQLRGAPLEQVRPQVEGALLMRRQGERMQGFVEELRLAYKLEVTLPYPNLPRIDVGVDDDPALGATEPVVTIVEFADYQCGYCRKVYPTLLELVEQYDGKVQIVYRDYPLGGPNPAGMAPMIAANCAGEQDKYWEVHETLMNEGGFSAPALEAAASSAGVDMDKWKACVADPTAQVAEITKDFEDGQSLGVNGTPAFYVNGIFLNGAVPKEQFVTIIERELAAQGS